MKTLNFSELKTGSILSETQFYEVAKVVGDKVQLKNDNGENIVVTKQYAESLLNSADQFTSTEKLSRTELVEKFMSSTGVALTANFNKKVDEKDVLSEIMNVHQNTAPKDVEKAFKSSIKKALEGEQRTMIGRHWGNKDEFGRVHFVDMQIAKDASKSYDVRQRLVDPRTLNWFIARGVKYQVK